MRKLFGIVIIFFALAFSLLLNSDANQAPIIYTSDSIQVKKEAVDFVSNNALDSKVSSYKAKKNNKYSNLTPLALSYCNTECLQKADRAQDIACNIQYLSGEKQKINQIRAP